MKRSGKVSVEKAAGNTGHESRRVPGLVTDSRPVRPPPAVALSLRLAMARESRGRRFHWQCPKCFRLWGCVRVRRRVLFESQCQRPRRGGVCNRHRLCPSPSPPPQPGRASHGARSSLLRVSGPDAHGVRRRRRRRMTISAAAAGVTVLSLRVTASLSGSVRLAACPACVRRLPCHGLPRVGVRRRASQACLCRPARRPRPCPSPLPRL
jgi:hypothetical protein